MYHTVTNAYFAGRNRGRGSERTVISQFAQKSEECIGLLDMSDNPERLLAAQHIVPRNAAQASEYMTIIITH